MRSTDKSKKKENSLRSGHLKYSILYSTEEQQNSFLALGTVNKELGGTITGEHGVGLAKKAYLPAALGTVALDSIRRLKASFDPNGILNPGKIFD